MLTIAQVTGGYNRVSYRMSTTEYATECLPLSQLQKVYYSVNLQNVDHSASNRMLQQSQLQNVYHRVSYSMSIMV